MTRRALLFAVVGAACSGSAPASPAAEGSQAGGGAAMALPEPPATRIGAACEASDGWQPTDLSVPASGGEPAALPVPDGYTDTPQLPPGVLFCLTPGGVYPNGYLTSNCESDADCPAGTLCDDVQCRLPCVDDAECTAPSICGVPAGKHQVRFCSCNACVLGRHTGDPPP